MRLQPFVPVFLVALLVAGCSHKPELAGRWECTTRHPGGFVSSDIFQFGPDSAMSLDSDGVPMHGSYTVTEDGTGLTIPLSDVPVPDGTTQQQTLTATIKKLTAEELEMDVSTGNDSHLSQCQRK